MKSSTRSAKIEAQLRQPEPAPGQLSSDGLDVVLPSVSSLTVTFNSAQFVDAHLQSLDQLEALTEIHIIDNQSPDNTFDVLERFRDRNFNRHVKLSRATSNSGFSVANNALATEIATDFLLIVNPDVIVNDPTLLANALRTFDEDDSVGIVGCRLTKADGSLDHACKRGEPTLLASLFYQTGLDTRFPAVKSLGRYRASHVHELETAEVDAVTGAFMLIPSSLYDECGGFDERFWMYGEDLDLCRKVRQLGYKIVYRGDIRATHLKGACSGKTRSPRAQKAFYESMVLYYEKWFGKHSLRTYIVRSLTLFQRLSARTGSGFAIKAFGHSRFRRPSRERT